MTLKQVRQELTRMGFTYDGWGKNLKYRSPKGKLLVVSSSPRVPETAFQTVLKQARKILKEEGS